MKPTTPETFWSRVNKTDGCWWWTGKPMRQGSHGYGQVVVRGRRMLAHRYAYEVSHGPVPPGLNVLHSCDNASCVRPEHLRAGTQLENIQEARAKNRLRFNPKRGEGRRDTKLKDAAVLEIRKRRAAGERGCDLAREFGVSQQLICDVAKGRGRGSV